MMEDQVVLTILGIMAASGGGVAAHLYTIQSRLRDRVEQSRDKIEASMASQLKDLWNQVRTLSEALNDDRREGSASRVHIATQIGKLVTREDLRDEMMRVVTQIDRNSKAPRRPNSGGQGDD